MTLHAGISTRLPEDEFEAAEAMVKIRPLWRAFTDALKEAGFKYDQELKISATKRPASTSANGARRTARKPRTDLQPQIPLQPEETDSA